VTLTIIARADNLDDFYAFIEDSMHNTGLDEPKKHKILTASVGNIHKYSKIRICAKRRWGDNPY